MTQEERIVSLEKELKEMKIIISSTQQLIEQERQRINTNIDELRAADHFIRSDVNEISRSPVFQSPR